MVPHEFTIPSSTRLVEVKDCGGCYQEIAPEVYKVMKNREHRDWLQREALDEFIQLDWTTPRYPFANILEMSRTWDSDKKCCTVDGRIVDLSLDALSSIFRLRGYGKKPRRNVKNWVSRFFDKAVLKPNGYLTSACKSSDVGHRIKFVTLTLNVNWIRSEAPQSIVQAVELPAVRNPEKKDWLGRMAHAFWKAMGKSQKMPATYVQVLLKAHLRIILDSVLRPDAVLPKSIRTRVDPKADLIRQAKRRKTTSIIQRARMGNPKPTPRTRLTLALANRKQAGMSETADLKKILVISTAQIKTGGSAQTRSGGLQSAQLKLVAGKPVAKKEEEDVSSLRAKECNEPEPGEKESNESQLEEEAVHESDSVVNLREEGAVHAGVETEREAEEIPGGAAYMGPDPPRETENEEMDVDPPKPSTVDEAIHYPEFSAPAEPFVGVSDLKLLSDLELLMKMKEMIKMEEMLQEQGRREVNRERREWDSERIKSQNRIETIEQENHELQQQLNSYRLQVIQNQNSKAEEEAAWREKHVDPVVEELAAKEKYTLALEKGAIDKNLELERVREQKFKCAKELTFYLWKKGRLEKEVEDLKVERVEQGKRIKDLEERVENAESELETTTVSLKTSQKVVNALNKDITALRKGKNEMILELKRVREQRAKSAQELTSNLCEKGLLEKEAEDLKAERVEQGTRIKDLEERVDKAESELETTSVSLKTSQILINERDKSIARANKVLKGLQGRIEKMAPELRKLYNLNLVPESEGSKKMKTEH